MTKEQFPMRLAFLPAAAIFCVIVPGAPSLAEGLDPATLAAVAEIATRDYANPGAAIVSGVRKSLARNGMGYCGEVTVEPAGAGTTVFHVLLETAGGPSVLRLVDFPESDTSANAGAVRQMMKNFGCVE
jgi:hypothetical protein